MNPTLPIILNGVIPLLNLIVSSNAVIIYSSLPENVVTRFETLQNKTVLPAALTRFFYVLRKVTGLIRTYTSSMVGYFFRAASVLAASQPEILSRRPNPKDSSGGNSFFKRVSP